MAALLPVAGDAHGIRSLALATRVLGEVHQDRDPGDISTIEDAGSVEEVRAAWQELRAEVQEIR
jgi:acetyl-CoA synthetase